ncbi:MAG: hypothetical protein PHV93_04640, partial [Candidatus Pacebacteria bacterium]|nr:hypothetical protein [Candidatus Paceibacterota bacterium]
MSNLRLENATASNMTNNVTETAPTVLNTDGVTSQDETTWQNSDWSKQWGYFNSVPELKSAMLMKACWDCGKGYTADPRTTVILDHISGWGKDTFLDILFNMDLISRLSGDAYAEIIKDDNGLLLNLKPLDPGSMRIVVDKQGIIKRYEQTNKTTGGAIHKFAPEEIFHLSHNRLADQIHGISDIISMQKVIDAEFESFDNMKKIMHRQAKPMIMFKIGTDNQAKINAFITKMDAATNKG